MEKHETPTGGDVVNQFKSRARRMRENAAEVTRELGLPAEAEGTVLRTLYGKERKPRREESDASLEPNLDRSEASQIEKD